MQLILALLLANISIHALVKRATSDESYYEREAEISIHALVKRATRSPRPRLRPKRYFNPRPREEGDRRCMKLSTVAQHFNPRPREEGDLTLPILHDVVHDFNPRPREEGDDGM